MTALTYFSVLIRAGDFAMDVMAIETEELRSALTKTAALLEPIRRVVDLEAVALRQLRIGDVELHDGVGERLSGTKGVEVAAYTTDRRDGDGRLHVALVADVVAQAGPEAWR